jgi:hypothetical protein
MVDIAFEIAGREVTPEQADEMERAVLEGVAYSIAEALGSVTCETHGMSPQVRVSGPDVRHLTFRVVGCCEPLVNEAMDRLK